MSDTKAEGWREGGGLAHGLSQIEHDKLIGESETRLDGKGHRILCTSTESEGMGNRETIRVA